MIGENLRAIAIAIGTFSRIPTPNTRRDREAVRLSVAYLPIVGVLIGVVMGLTAVALDALRCDPALFAALSFAIPVIITGGIHFDGFCDTEDALASWATTERKLEIMKDPNAGAFAIVRFGAYIVVWYALARELYVRGFGSAIVGVYATARCFGALAATRAPKARKTGMLAAYSADGAAGARAQLFALLFVAAITGLAWFVFTGVACLFAVAACFATCFLHWRMTKKNFGGHTGDTVGHCISSSELAALAGLTVAAALLGG